MKTDRAESKSSQSWIRRHPVWTGILVVIGLLLLLVAAAFLLPFNVDDASVSNLVTSYDEALTRINSIQNAEKASGEINPLCISNVMSHGEQTEKVIVFYHGFTSCPEQFRELGETFFEQGYNIYIPRLPHHGHADQMSDALLKTSAEELAGFATESINIARGLGDEVIVAGLSGGGTIATWIAQEHEDVDTAVMVAPFLGIGFIPTVLNRPLTQIADNIPNIWMWWDPTTKEKNPFTQSYQYPRYPLHALAEYMRLGFAAERDAKQNKPGVERLIVITNANDESINNGIVAQFEDLWQQHGEEFMRSYQFEKNLGLPHDVITPTREDGNTALTYPIIIDYITGTEE
jgi:pimeloyl-ACP methyl ester carboxylesterase